MTPDSHCFGIDLRPRDLLVPGDLMPSILTTPSPLSSGPVDAPTLKHASPDKLQGGSYHVGAGRFVPTAGAGLPMAPTG